MAGHFPEQKPASACRRGVDRPNLADRGELDARRQAIARLRVEENALRFDVPLRARDPAGLLLEQVRDLRPVEVRGHDDLKAVAERETQVNVLCAATLAHGVVGQRTRI
jgi:hypothetical protein